MIPWCNAISAAVATCAALAALPAAAVDGEILIDQARANAGGITPGDAPGFPATLSRPGRYKLTGNLAVPAGQAGIEVAQDEVTIDFNGFTVSSNPTGQAPFGVFTLAGGGLRIINGTIAGFQQSGISQAGARTLVENMRIVSNGIGIHVVTTEGRVRNSTIANNTTGIACPGCLIEQNVVTGNTESGIIVYGQGVVLGNVIASNGGYGLASQIESSGYGNNILFGNNAGQVFGLAHQLHPNICEPSCP